MDGLCFHQKYADKSTTSKFITAQIFQIYSSFFRERKCYHLASVGRDQTQSWNAAVSYHSSQSRGNLTKGLALSLL